LAGHLDSGAGGAVYHSFARRRLRGHRSVWLAAAALALVYCAPASSEPLRWGPGSDGDQNKPIDIRATNVATWAEQGHRYLLLKGNVLIQQGGVIIRAGDGVIRIDENDWQRTGVYRLDVY